MTTSGSTSNDPVRDIVVKKALRLVGAYATMAKPVGDQIDDAIEALNMMIKSWQIHGFMFLREFVTLFLVPGQVRYALPGAIGATTVVKTALSGDLAALDTVVGVDDSTGMTAADIVGVYLDDGSLHWDVIYSVDSSTQITLTTGVSGAASENSAVYAYAETYALYRPTRVFSAQRKNSSNSEVSLNAMSRDDYAEQVNKENTGTPTQYYYDFQKGTGYIYFWPAPQNSDIRVILDVDRPLQLMVDSSNTYDFPEEWAECIAYGLAVRLAPEYAVPLGERRELKNEFIGLVTNLLDYNKDWVSVVMGAEHG
jgi:hypothetical protein